MFNEMIKSIPTYERKSTIFNEKFIAESKQFGLLNTQIEDIRKQFIVDTATWGLSIYEKELGLVVPKDSTLDSRRAAIKAKWRTTGKVDRVLLEAVASAILQTVVKVEFTGEIIFKFDSKDIKTPILDYSLFEYMINEIKPAHLGMLINISHQFEMNLYYGGIISTRSKIEIHPAAFRMPTLQQTKYFGGVISTKTKIELQEVR